MLILQPFLNDKFNFIKIKLSFKDATKVSIVALLVISYMICRLVIIIIIIANSFNDFITTYVLITTCGIIALIHLTEKSYSNEILNRFDDIILHLIIFIAALQSFDDFSSPLAITMAFVLVTFTFVKFYCNDSSSTQR